MSDKKEWGEPRKVIIEFDVYWQDYEDVSDELLVEDMFSDCAMKEGVAYGIVTASHSRLVQENEELKNKIKVKHDALKGLAEYFAFMVKDPQFHEYVNAVKALEA